MSAVALAEAAREMAEHDAARFMVIYYGNTRVERPAPYRRPADRPRPARRAKATRPKPAAAKPAKPARKRLGDTLRPHAEAYDSARPAPEFLYVCACGRALGGSKHRRCWACRTSAPAPARPCAGACGRILPVGATSRRCHSCKYKRYGETHPPCPCGAPAARRGFCLRCFERWRYAASAARRRSDRERHQRYYRRTKAAA